MQGTVDWRDVWMCVSACTWGQMCVTAWLHVGGYVSAGIYVRTCEYVRMHVKISARTCMWTCVAVCEGMYVECMWENVHSCSCVCVCTCARTCWRFGAGQKRNFKQTIAWASAEPRVGWTANDHLIFFLFICRQQLNTRLTSVLCSAVLLPRVRLGSFFTAGKWPG